MSPSNCTNCRRSEPPAATISIPAMCLSIWLFSPAQCKAFEQEMFLHSCFCIQADVDSEGPLSIRFIKPNKQQVEDPFQKRRAYPDVESVCKHPSTWTLTVDEVSSPHISAGKSRLTTTLSIIEQRLSQSAPCLCDGNDVYKGIKSTSCETRLIPQISAVHLKRAS